MLVVGAWCLVPGAWLRTADRRRPTADLGPLTADGRPLTDVNTKHQALSTENKAPDRWESEKVSTRGVRRLWGLPYSEDSTR
jgi:hypothetical protein